MCINFFPDMCINLLNRDRNFKITNGHRNGRKILGSVTRLRVIIICGEISIIDNIDGDISVVMARHIVRVGVSVRRLMNSEMNSAKPFDQTNQ